MSYIILRIVLNALMLYLTAHLVPGIVYRGGLLQLLFAGFVFGLINLIVKPVVLILSLPLILLSLGLFYFVVNGILLWFVSLFVPGFSISNIVAAIVGSIVLSLLNWVLSWILGIE